MHNQELLICPYQILVGWSNQGGCDRWGMWCVWRRGEVHAEFWWGNLREIDHLEKTIWGGDIG